MYIREIERANDQLKLNAAALFQQKGLSREQQELFLKKVNFTENREYFFQKRKTLTGSADEEPEPSESSPLEEEVPSEHAEARPEPAADPTRQKNFFDAISSSCRFDDDAGRSRDGRRDRSQKHVRFQERRRGPSSGQTYPPYSGQSQSHRRRDYRQSKDAHAGRQPHPNATVWRPKN